jgi:hypothetical protein
VEDTFSGACPVVTSHTGSCWGAHRGRLDAVPIGPSWTRGRSVRTQRRQSRRLPTSLAQCCTAIHSYAQRWSDSALAPRLRSQPPKEPLRNQLIAESKPFSTASANFAPRTSSSATTSLGCSANNAPQRLPGATGPSPTTGCDYLSTTDSPAIDQQTTRIRSHDPTRLPRAINVLGRQNLESGHTAQVNAVVYLGLLALCPLGGEHGS